LSAARTAGTIRRDPPARAYLASYSPYDNVPDGGRPSLLVTGSLHDPRVLIHEPAKWVARLRATAAPGSRLLFRPELGAGAHVGPAGRYDLLRYEAEILAFILDEAGITPTLRLDVGSSRRAAD
jgi:oligopeptidase B